MIVPVRSIDNIATFVSLLKGNNLIFVILHDYNGKNIQRLENLSRNNLLKQKSILNYAVFRKRAFIDDKSGWIESDVEDLFSHELYVKIFNNTFSGKLNGKMLTANDIQEERIVLSINKWLKANNIQLKQDWTFNHYLPSL
jgi:hypothetical protein